MTPIECLWYAVIYAYMWLGAGYWLRKLVSICTSERRTPE